MLDLAQLAGSETEQTGFLTRLRESARDVRFFYLINHGINPQLQQNVQSITCAFFKLPQEEKLRVSMIHSSHFRSYNLAGVEYTREQRDQREQFDIGADRELLLRRTSSAGYRWT